MITRSFSPFKKTKTLSVHLSVFIILFSFSANSHVLLESPNGGEILYSNTQVTIQWKVQIRHATISWELEYSKTGTAGPWIVIAQGLPVGDPTAGSIHTYDWLVPEVLSDLVRIRVIQNNELGNYNDYSDANLSIMINAPPQVSAIMPQMVQVGDSLNLEVLATDADGTSPMLTALNLPDNSGFTDNGDGTGLFYMSPTFSQIGMHDLTFVADDGIQADSELVTISVNPCCLIAGDFNGNDEINISDLTTTVSWMFKDGAAPDCLNSADVNGSCSVDIADLSYRVNYMFKDGSNLVCGCSE